MFRAIRNSLTVAFTSNLCKLSLIKKKENEGSKKIKVNKISQLVILLCIITRDLILVYMRMEPGEDIFAA